MGPDKLDGQSFSKVQTYMNISMYEIDNAADKIFLLWLF